jgi:hypothetical protein
MANAQLEAAKRQLEAAIQALDPPQNTVSEPAPAQLTATAAPVAERAAPEPADTIQTFTRLVVGTVLLGFDGLATRASGWERQASAALGEQPAGAPVARAAAEAEQQETTGAAMRQALAGWVFAGQDRLRAASDPGEWLRAASAHMVNTTRTLTGEMLGRDATPGRTLSEWISRGQAEEQRSKQIARLALAELTHEALNYLAHDQSLQELVQKQSRGLAAELLDEVRERAVSADVTVDRLMARLFRRRAALSEVGEAVRETRGGQR